MTSPAQAARDWRARLLAEGRNLPEWWFVAKVPDEAGEALGAYLRLAGLHRRAGELGEVADELADTVISAYAAAGVLGIDLDAAVDAKARVLLTRDLGRLGYG